MGVLDDFGGTPVKSAPAKKKAAPKKRKAKAKAPPSASSAIEAVQKKLMSGANAVLIKGRMDNIEKSKHHFSFGIPVIHQAMGSPLGLPSGRIMTVWGDSSSGKSYLCSNVISTSIKDMAEERAPETYVLLGNTEVAPIVSMLRHAGVDYDEWGPACRSKAKRNHIRIESPKHVEGLATWFIATTGAIRKVSPNARILWVWDSVARTPSKHDFLRTDLMKNEKVANLASSVKSILGKFRDTVVDQQVGSLIVNQLRVKIATGGMGGMDDRSFTGGKRLYFDSDYVMFLKTYGKITREVKRPTIKGRAFKGRKSRVLGYDVVARMEKVRGAPCDSEASYRFLFDRGIDDVEATCFFLANARLVKASGKVSIKIPGYKLIEQANWVKFVDTVRKRPKTLVWMEDKVSNWPLTDVELGEEKIVDLDDEESDA